MIRREYGKIIFCCDSCDDEFETGTDDWASAHRLAKEDGWKAEQVGKDWINGCQNCGT